MTSRFMQAYQQAPWRIQVQRLGKVMLSLVGVALVAGMYLSITANAATAGLRIRALNYEREAAMRQISDLNSQLAFLTSAANMDERSAALGYELLSNEKALYIILPGYVGRQPAEMAPAATSKNLPQPLIKPIYTQSLWDWLTTGLAALDDSQGEMP